MIRLTLVLHLLFGASLAVAQEAPFGLIWGATVDQVRATGVELKEDDSKQYGVSFSSAKLPKALSDQEGALLAFGYNNKLWRVVAFGKVIENDPYGTTVKDRYQALVEALASKYGPPRSLQRLGASIYKEPRYFLAGLKGGESHWYSDFTTTGIFVQASIVASSSSDARWRIIFEDKNLSKQFEVDKKVQERGAL